MAGLTPLARSAEVAYLRLAKGPITATATLGADKEKLLSTLDADGRVEFPVSVDLSDSEGTKVAEMTVYWHVRKSQGRA